MSEENLEIVKRAINRWNGGERIPDEEIHPNVEIVSRLMGGDSFHGREGIRTYFQELDEHFDDWTVVPDEWRDVGDHVVMLGGIHLHGRESGITLDQRRPQTPPPHKTRRYRLGD